jgi:hypothetical protein
VLGEHADGKVLDDLKVRWEITSTVFDLLFGTYTSAGSPRTVALSWPLRSAA